MEFKSFDSDTEKLTLLNYFDEMSLTIDQPLNSLFNFLSIYVRDLTTDEFVWSILDKIDITLQRGQALKAVYDLHHLDDTKCDAEQKAWLKATCEKSIKDYESAVEMEFNFIN